MHLKCFFCLSVFFYYLTGYAQHYYGNNDLRPVYQQDIHVISLPGGIEVRQPESKTEYLLCDHLYSTRLTINQTNVITTNTGYDPYGKISGGIHRSSENGLLFTGTYTWDTSARLYLSPGRKYDPVAARYMSIDPYRQLATSYSYIAGNPQNYIDEDGCYGNSFWWRYSPLGWLYSIIGWQTGTVLTIHNNKIIELDSRYYPWQWDNKKLRDLEDQAHEHMWLEGANKIFIVKLNIDGLNEDNQYHYVLTGDRERIKSQFAFGSGKNRYFDMDRYHRQLFHIIEQRRSRPKKTRAQEEQITAASLINELPPDWQIAPEQNIGRRRKTGRKTLIEAEEPVTEAVIEGPAEAEGIDYTRYYFESMKVRNLFRQLDNNDQFSFVRQTGSHHIYRFNPTGKTHSISDRGANALYNNNLLRNMAEGFGLDEETIGLFGGTLMR